VNHRVKPSCSMQDLLNPPCLKERWVV